MCYDIKTSLETQLRRAEKDQDLQAIADIRERLAPLTDLPLHHASGFTHPEVLIYTNKSPNFPEVATWGLVPHWTRDTKQQKQLWNATLNARGETIFEKPAFRDAAQHHRCIIYVDGFYEHHHQAGKTYPFFIQHKEKQPLALAGLWSEWRNPETRGLLRSFTIVTTEANALMKHLHNNPKLKAPRMPFLLPHELEDAWLEPSTSDADKKSVQKLIAPLADGELTAHPVARLRGKEYLGNVEGVSNAVVYPELVIS
ncbi:SOS response-associated peptidase [Maribacter chungangensis]|uniref:Abasic site processing protein n=1 Tax=Maribacter chungangensis TaxID=1069117 RepID=A0ABW3B9P7_9FLAO